MNRIGKIALAAIVALAVSFGGGWYYGSGRASEGRALAAGLDYSLAVARGQLLEGRVELYSNNFGNASRRFDQAKRQLGEAIALLEQEKQSEPANALRQALTAIDLAIQRANRLEPAAHESAASALKTLDAVIDDRARRLLTF